MDAQTKTNVGIGATLLAALSTGLIPVIGFYATPLILISAIIAVWFLWPLIKSVTEHLTVDEFFALIGRLKLLRQAHSVTGWSIPFSARTEFGDASDVTRFLQARGELDRLVHEYEELRRKLQKAVKQYGHIGLSPMASQEAPEIVGARNLVSLSQEKITNAQIALNRSDDSLVRWLIANLSEGELIAKGFPLINGIAQREHIIPPSEWRVLKLDVLNETANGHGLSYVGVVIGKPRRK